MKTLNQAKNTWFQMNKTSEKAGEVLIYNDIGMWGINESDFDTALKGIGQVDTLTIRVNSYGGEVFVGFAIYNRIKEHTAKNKIIIIDGVAASIASVIALAGTELHMAKNSFLMIHNPSVFVGGTSDDLRKSADLLDKLKDVIVSSYKEKVKNLSEKELSDMMDNETWISSGDGLKYGFADKVVDFSESDEPETNSTKKLPENLKQILLATDKIPEGMQRPTMKGIVMKCPHCGKEHAENAVFCAECGGRIVALAPVVSPSASAASQAEKAELVASERKRISMITSHCRAIGLPEDFAQTIVDSGETLDEASVKIVAKLQETKPLVPVNIRITADGREKYRNHAALSIQNAIGLIKDPAVREDLRKNPGPTDLHGLIRNELLNEGKLSASAISSLSAGDLAVQAFRISNAMGSSDLPNILADTMNKSFLMTPTEAGATYDQVCAVAETNDFRTTSFTKLSSFGDIDLLPEGANFKQGGFSDAKEQMALSTYGKTLSLTRQLIVNNDTNALALFPQKIMRATYGKANRLFYDMLLSNSLAGPTLLEGGALFLAAKGNLLTNGSIATVAALGGIENAIAMTKCLKSDPKDPDTFVTGGLRKILSGSLNKNAWLQLLMSGSDPSKTNSTVYNPYNGNIQLICDSYLQSKLTTANKANAYYGLADPAQFPTVTALYLAGNRTPSVRNEPSGVGEAQGITWEFFWDIAFGCQDWRGIVYSDGVTAG